ncbi:ArsR/SmtB family transcription factor [Nonomuraea helvata]|uniref:ArsR/SmtB family transcription factor n=1 Tax=Nonomuraea helvata TaxID=37484 RepID=A0ABV5S464_9ACTN
MVYRIHFTSQDLARTRVAEAPMPLAELQLAIRMLQDREAAWLDGWRRRVLPRLPQHAHMVLSLVPAVGWAPTFLGPGKAGTLQELIEHVRATPSDVVNSELAMLAERQAVPAWARSLGDDERLRGHLYNVLEQLYDQLLSPYWQRLTDWFVADRAVRMQHLLTGGVERLLTLANPRWMRWKPPVLEVRMANGFDHDLHLQGQGIVLVPSAFASRSIVEDDENEPQVSYPLPDHQSLNRLTALVPEQEVLGSMGALAALLGNTRAAVLVAIAERPGCTTTELAAFSGTTPPGASQHATVLRQAGLIHTTRYRNTALHTATALGMALLNRSDGTADPRTLQT